MNILAVVTPLSIYHVCSTRKTFREGYFTPVNMKNCGHHNVRKHRDIKNGEKYITLDISLKFGSLDKMKSTNLQSQNIIWEDQERGWLPLWVSTPLKGKIKKIRQGMPLIMSVWRIFLRLSRNFRDCLMRVMCGRGPKMNPLTVTFI